MKNNRLLLLSFLLIASMILAACGGSSAPAEEAPKPAATPATAGGNTPTALDPANESGEKVRAAVSYVYEGLVTMKEDELAPALAEVVEVSDDGLEYTFNLRPGVTFHDGATLNADLVIANFNRWFDPKDPNRGSGKFEAWVKNFKGFKGETTSDGKPKSQYDGAEKVNDFTVLVHLNTPDPDFLKKLTDPAFVISSPAGFTGGDGGSGPYKMGKSDAAKVMLEPFAGYWDKAAVPAKGMEAPLK
jgi:ABC-type transport system substrate-binding protein